MYVNNDITFCSNDKCSLANKCQRTLHGVFNVDRPIWIQPFTPNNNTSCDFLIEINTDMVKEITTYSLVCDICNKDHNADTEFTGWNKIKFEVQQAVENGWLIGNYSDDHNRKIQYINTNKHQLTSARTPIVHVCAECSQKII